jgi:hypothetical protein
MQHLVDTGGKQDLFLIMDVARFKYAPHWVPLPLLMFSAMNTIDSDDDLSRGWMTIQASQELNLRFSHGCRSAKNKADVGSNAEVDDNAYRTGDIDLESNGNQSFNDCTNPWDMET